MASVPPPPPQSGQWVTAQKMIIIQVVSELYKSRLNKAKDPNLFFYRDSHKKEIDILFEKNRDLVPLEIKSSATYNSDLIKNLSFFFKSVSPDSESGYLVYSGESGSLADKVQGLNFKSASLCFD